MVQAFGVVVPGGGVGVFLLLVDLAGGDAVAEHFYHVVDRYLHAAHFVAQLRGVVDPVLQVVPVSSLVVEPGGGIALLQAFYFVRAPGALVVFDGGEKFDGGVFAQVVEEALLVEARLEAVFHNTEFMGSYGFEVAPNVAHTASSSGGPAGRLRFLLTVRFAPAGAGTGAYFSREGKVTKARLGNYVS